MKYSVVHALGAGILCSSLAAIVGHALLGSETPYWVEGAGAAFGIVAFLVFQSSLFGKDDKK